MAHHFDPSFDIWIDNFSFYQRVEPNHRPFVLAMVVIVAAVAIAIERFRDKRKKKVSESAALVEITAREIRIAGESGWAIAPWCAFGKLIESETFFVLPHRQGHTLYIFPKRAFPTVDECERCREILSRHATPSTWFWG